LREHPLGRGYQNSQSPAPHTVASKAYARVIRQRRAAARLRKNFRHIEALTAYARRGDLAELLDMALIHKERWRNEMFAFLTILTVLIATMFVVLVASTLRELRNESADAGERALWKTSR